MPTTTSPKNQYICKYCLKPYCRYPSRAGKFCSLACRKESESVKNSLWKFVNKTDSCWLWNGATITGYGAFRHRLAHRVIWELLIGPIPQGMELCHNCPGGDNRLCVNPDHHFVGTRKQNAEDAVKKGRILKGEQVHFSKLKESQILEIRELLKTRKQYEIARMYDVDQSTISYIKTGRIWKFLT